MLKVRGAVQNYGWGRVGHASNVAKLYALSSGTEVEENLPYAELWMGTHPSAPSFLLGSAAIDDDRKTKSSPDDQAILLNEWLEMHPEALGEAVCKRWNGNLPFLFKVLSVAKALSIQAHPDKQLAEQLFQKHPKVYKDPNHKPEMALAVTNFEALCGFVTSEELKQALRSVPELKRLLEKGDVEELLNVGEESTSSSKAVLRRAFTTLMTREKEEVVKSVRALKSRLTNEKESRELSPREQLLLTLETQYPDDVGVLASLFLNYIQLKPGEAVYLAANVPHAYISGECVECMATSDNVVRAGLTPKFRDTATLSSMLTYDQGVPQILNGSPVSAFTKRYSPPFDEFEVDMITVPEGHSLEFSPIPGPSIFLVSDGAGTIDFGGEVADRSTKVKQGDIFFLPAGRGLHISSSQTEEAHTEGHANGHEHPAGEIGKGLANGNANGSGLIYGSRHTVSNRHGSQNGRTSGDARVNTSSDGIPIRLYRAGVNSVVL